jgi:hypothetical protein
MYPNMDPMDPIGGNDQNGKLGTASIKRSWMYIQLLYSVHIQNVPEGQKPVTNTFYFLAYSCRPSGTSICATYQ